MKALKESKDKCLSFQIQRKVQKGVKKILSKELS